MLEKESVQDDILNQRIDAQKIQNKINTSIFINEKQFLGK